MDRHTIVSVVSLHYPPLLSTNYLLDISLIIIRHFGGIFLSHKAAFRFVLLRQQDINKLIAHPKTLRDQIIIDFSRLQGLRTHEITTLQWNNISVENGFIYMLDSKKHVRVLLPLHWHLAEQLQIHKEETSPDEDDWIIRPAEGVNIKKSAWGKPISNDTIHDVVKRTAKEAGIFDWRRYNSTLLRAYFAADWYRKGRSLKILQYMMRHNNLAMTFRYVSKILFWSEVSREFDRVQNDRRTEKKLSIKEILESPVARQCLECPAVQVCKYTDEAIHNEYADGCRFFREIVKKAQRIKLSEVVQT